MTQTNNANPEAPVATTLQEPQSEQTPQTPKRAHRRLSDDERVAAYVALAETRFQHGRVNFAQASRILAQHGYSITPPTLAKLWHSIEDRQALSQFFNATLRELYNEELRRDLRFGKENIKAIISLIQEITSDRDFIAEKIRETRNINDIAQAQERLYKLYKEFATEMTKHTDEIPHEHSAPRIDLMQLISVYKPPAEQEQQETFIDVQAEQEDAQ